jgi:hypothetical protein
MDNDHKHNNCTRELFNIDTEVKHVAVNTTSRSGLKAYGIVDMQVPCMHVRICPWGRICIRYGDIEEDLILLLLTALCSSVNMLVRLYECKLILLSS